MSSRQNSTRQRLINAALELFVSQGFSETATKQIAELAQVNEVTLFRHFGNKHGLLLAALEETAIFKNLGQTLLEQSKQNSSIERALKDYATACLEALEGVAAVVRSVVGEAGQYPAENREALGRGFTHANRYVAQYLQIALDRDRLHLNLSAEKLASLLNGMLLGYAVIEFTSEFHELWQDREDFLENLVMLFLHGAVSQLPGSASNFVNPVKSELAANQRTEQKVADLSSSLVHLLLQRAQKLGRQEYALIYVLFGAGLSPGEIKGLERRHYISDAKEQLLQIDRGLVREVPINQWILGKRYGSYTKNPLTQWLKSRKDDFPSLFIDRAGEPLSETEIKQRWQQLFEELEIAKGRLPKIEQAQQTWCVEMLMRGMSVDNLSILTGWDSAKLQPYVQRAKEKTALKQAINLDRL